MRQISTRTRFQHSDANFLASIEAFMLRYLMAFVASRTVQFSLLAAVVALVGPAQASGNLIRTFVSSTGNDSNPCTITKPCASFAAAYTATSPNGIIAALDPGKYGPLTINGPVVINGNGWAAITAPARGNGITINAGATDSVTLIGLEIDGAGAGYNGILLNSAGSLTVTGSVLQNFVSVNLLSTTTGNGILIQPTSGTLDFAIYNTRANNNGYAGINYTPAGGSPSANGVIDHVIANNNQFGIAVNAVPAASGTTNVTMSNGIASNNYNSGIFVGVEHNSPKIVNVSVDNMTVAGNFYGVDASGIPNMTLGRSVITGNHVGVLNDTLSNTLYTYGDNRINLNINDLNGSLNADTISLQ
jgi:hypothetical protein